MVSSILIFCAICFILVQINVANRVNNASPDLYKKNTTNVLSPSESGRSKRSLVHIMPNSLQIDVRISQTLNSMTWHKIHSIYLANKYLPVDIPLDEKSRVENIMEDVGDFVLYHDHETHSAVVYFGKSKTFFGVIGTDYYIQNLPYNFDENNKYRGVLTENEYLKKRSHPLFHNLPRMGFPTSTDTNICETSKLNQNNKRPSDSEAGPSNKQHCTEHNPVDDHQAESVVDFDINVFNARKRRESVHYRKYILESLIFVCRDIVNIFKKEYGDDYLVWIVRYFIIYFNAVGLTFRKLRGSNSRFRINIARIVMDDDLIPFTFINDDELQYPEIVSKLPKYLETNSFQYPSDSFDHVFIFTSRTIMNEGIPIQGSTKYGADLYEARKNNKNFYEVVPITVMTVKPQYDDYLFTVQEIGRVLRLDINSYDDYLKTIKQCCDSNREQRLQCQECLQWSDISVIRFNQFSNENRNRCIYLNLPRSIHPPGKASISLPFAQCQCFGYKFYGKSINSPALMIEPYECKNPLLCTKVDGGKNYREPTVRPFDGTPCGKMKVCWEGVCHQLNVLKQKPTNV